MSVLKRALVALVLIPAGISAGGASAAPRHKLPANFKLWARVSVCESGGERVLGYSYPDSEGITRANYLAFGGRPLPVGRLSLREQIAEVEVGNRLIAHYHMGVPDQGRCAAW